MMTPEQFGWVELIRDGKVDISISYYGGWKCDITGKCIYCEDDNIFSDRKNDLLSKIKIHGIDWDKSKEPEEDDVNVFAGTFVDADTTTVLRGELVLKNGDVHSIIDDSYVRKSPFDMMSRVKEYEEYFNDNLNF